MPVAALIVILGCLALTGCGSGSGREATPDPAVVVWAVGDGGDGGESSRQVAQLIARDEPDQVIYLGDVYESGSAEEFRVFGEDFAPLLTRMWPTPGNHDWPNHADGYDPFWRKALGRPLAHRYERSAAGWQVLSANSQTPDDAGQLEWLRSRADSGGTCRIAFWHRPHLNAGAHTNEQEDIKPLLAFSNDQTEAALRIQLTPGHADLRFIAPDGTVLDHSDVSCEA